MWQDYVLLVATIILSISLFPSIFSRHKPSCHTSWSSGLTLAIYATVYMTLHLYIAGAATYVTSVLWFVLLYQRLKG